MPPDESELPELEDPDVPGSDGELGLADVPGAQSPLAEELLDEPGGQSGFELMLPEDEPLVPPDVPELYEPFPVSIEPPLLGSGDDVCASARPAVAISATSSVDDNVRIFPPMKIESRPLPSANSVPPFSSMVRSWPWRPASSDHEPAATRVAVLRDVLLLDSGNCRVPLARYRIGKRGPSFRQYGAFEIAVPRQPASAAA